MISSKFLFILNDANYRNEILYNDPSSGKVKVYKISEKKSTFFTEKYRAADTDCLNPVDVGLSIPHSTAYLDLDGDCMPDLFLTKTDPVSSETIYEIYIQRVSEGKQRYCLV